MKRPDLITMPGVAKAMGVELSQAEATSVGSALANRWAALHGERPPKYLNGKSRPDQGGTHCHAHYPASWRPIIEEAIRALGVEADRQGSLPL